MFKINYITKVELQLNDSDFDFLNHLCDSKSQDIRFDRGDLLNDPDYGPLRNLLTNKIRKEIERPSNHIIAVMDSPTESHDRDQVLREVARIEKSWGLI